MEDKSFLQTLKELAEVQASIAKVDAQISIRTGKDQIKKALGETKDKIVKAGNRLGVSANKIEEDYLSEKEGKQNILKDYEETLEQINEIYDVLIENTIDKIEQLEADEFSNMLDEKETSLELQQALKENKEQKNQLKSEMINAMNNGDMEIVIEKAKQFQEIEGALPNKEDNSTKNNRADDLAQHKKECEVRRIELRKQIEELEEECMQYIEYKMQAIEDATKDKNTQLAENKKQNIFKRAMGFILSKINGAKSFVKSVINPLDEKIQDLKTEEIPKIENDVKEKTENLSNEVLGKRLEIEENAKAKGVEFRGKWENAKENIGEFLNKIGVKATDIKDKVIGAKDFVADKANNAIDFVADKTTNAIVFVEDKARGVKDGINTAVTNTVEFGKRTYSSIVNKGIDTKRDIISFAQRKLEEKQEKLNQKQQSLNNDNKEQDDNSER